MGSRFHGNDEIVPPAKAGAQFLRANLEMK